MTVSSDKPEPKPISARNERRKARTRAKLLAASRKLFANQGIDQTTIGEIAELADTGVGSFYNHFGSKDDVIAALLQAELAIELRVLRTRQEQVEDVAERVSVAHRSLLERIRADSDLGWLIVRLDAVYEIGVNFMREAAVADLRAGIESKRFNVDDPEVAWRVSAGAFLGIAQAVVRGELPESADPAHAAAVLRLFGVPPEEAFEISRRPMPPAAEDSEFDDVEPESSEPTTVSE